MGESIIIQTPQMILLYLRKINVAIVTAIASRDTVTPT